MRSLDLFAYVCTFVGFTANASAASYSVLASINGTGDGAAPYAALTPLGGVFYGVTANGGATGNGTVFKFDPTTKAETVLYDFTGYDDGSVPLAGLVAVSGVLYGTTEYGGSANAGTVFKVDPSTGTKTTLYSFGGTSDGGNPSAAMVQVKNALYGTTQFDGNGGGTIFRLDPATGAVTTVYGFGGGADGSQPYGGLLASGNVLYGTTSYGGGAGSGSVFKFDLASDKKTTLYSFAGGTDAASPAAALVSAGGVLYGTAAGGGTAGFGAVFSVAIKSGKEAVLHSFGTGSDGQYPYAPLLASGGLFYSTTVQGGSGGYGTIFSFDASTGSVATVHSFTYGGDGVIPYAGFVPSGSVLLGATTYGGSHNQGALVSFDPASGQETPLYGFTGSTPEEGVTVAAAGGKLAVNASDAGSAGFGALLSVDPSSGAATTLFDFTGIATGDIPGGPLLPLSGAYYGTTLSGGNTGCGGGGCGTIYKVDGSGTETVLYAFGTAATDGYVPETGVIAIGNTLYGTTYNGGGTGCGGVGCGSVYSYNLKTHKQTLLHGFAGADGQYPFAPLVNVAGTLFGTTILGGPGGAGIVYKVDAKTGAQSVVYGFTGGADGGYPYAGVIGVGGKLYGTTYQGGASGAGTVFVVDPATGKESVLYSFAGGSDGANPAGGLVDVKGVLYGSTAGGGTGGYGCQYVCGTVFSVNAKTGAHAILHTFLGAGDGGNPFGALVSMGGTLFGGTGSGGAHGLGTIFALTP